MLFGTPCFQVCGLVNIARIATQPACVEKRTDVKNAVTKVQKTAQQCKTWKQTAHVQILQKEAERCVNDFDQKLLALDEVTQDVRRIGEDMKRDVLNLKRKQCK